MISKTRFLSSIAVNCCRNNRLFITNAILSENKFNNILVNNRMKRFVNTSQQMTENNEKTGKVDYQSVDSLKDRSHVVSAEQSRLYMKSEAFKSTYAHYKVWQLFRRNFKGQFSPFRSRQTCIVENTVYTSNPCVVCRDQYLVLHYTNTELLTHFIDPHSGYVYENTILCLCGKQYENLLVAINLAKQYGLITFQMPVRTYEYNDYYSKHKLHNHCSHKSHNK